MRRARSLADVLLAALCLWAAWYHTPPGALLRTAVARLSGSRGATPALLSYYGAGALQLAEPLPPRAALSPGAALGLGAQSALERISPPDRAQVLARAGLKSSSADALGDWIGREAERQGSREAAVLALFCGEEAARFARERASGSGLEELARQLPPRYADRIALAATALTLGTAYALAWPLPDSAQVTSSFGLRAHPLLGARRFHSGIDLGVPIGTPVRAAADGIVRRASDDRVSGRLVLLDHGSGVSTVYCHNDSLRVAPGDAVKKGQVIALSGNSGLSTGPHLHYQLDLPQGPADPLLFRAARPPQLATGGTEP
ncbi:MAG TPA: M23 family metallopeptidase [Myxococcales bacterium]|nr:M23 family metallopeptidase [Myxococcales bacterium]